MKRKSYMSAFMSCLMIAGMITGSVPLITYQDK